MLSLILLGILSSLIADGEFPGCTGLIARLVGMSSRDAAMLGVGMSARGAVELIVADIGFRAGLFAQPEPVPPIIANMFSAIVVMAIVTTMFVLLLLRLFVPPAR